MAEPAQIITKSIAMRCNNPIKLIKVLRLIISKALDTQHTVGDNKGLFRL